MTGGAALQGLGARNGVRLAIKLANDSNYPYRVEAVDHDDEAKPDVGVAAALKLVNDPRVMAAIGHWSSPVALATTPIMNQNQMPFIVWGAISPRVTEPNYPFVTRASPTLTAENRPLARFLVKDLGLKKLAIVSDTSDYGAASCRWRTRSGHDGGVSWRETLFTRRREGAKLRQRRLCRP